MGEADTTYDRVFDLQWRNAAAGTRDELRIWAADSTLELEKANVSVKVNMDLYGWHTYRVVVMGDSAAVFIDENPELVIGGVSLEANTDNYIKIGDGSGDAIGGYLDWCILDTAGAYLPGEGLAFPEGLFVDGLIEPLVPMWLVYDGSVLPSETGGGGGDTLDLTSLSDNSPGAGFIQEVMDDPDITGNKLLKYLHPDGKTMYRHYFDDGYTDSSITLIARIKGENDAAYDRAFDLQWRIEAAGSRDELRIWPADSTLELEKAGVEVKVDLDLYSWHTYRVVVDGDLATVFIDENPNPVISGVSTEANTDNYIKIGDGSGEAIGGYLDWCILDVSGAYAPGDGLAIPAGLFVDQSTLPMWLVYDASVLPSVTGGGGSMLDLTSTSQDSPGAGFVEEIIDDPEMPGNGILKYLQPTGGGNKMYRNNFASGYTDTAFTIIARIKGENDSTYQRAFDIQWRNGNASSRDELRIWAVDGELELEKSDARVSVSFDPLEWNTYRIVVNGDYSEIYVNENPDPIISGTATETTTDTYIKIGDGSSDVIGGYLDWIIVDYSGAFGPGEGLAIPAGLIVDTTPISLIVVDGEKDAFYNNLTGPADGYLQIRSFANTDNGAPDDDADLSAKVWTAWDETWFYLYEEVTDDIISGDASNVWEEDELELKFDPQPTDSTINSIWDTRLTALGAGEGDAVASDDLGPLTAENKQFVRKLTDNGYVLELGIKWSAIVSGTGAETITPAVDNVFGLAVQNHDNDETAARVATVAWAARLLDAVWNTPKYTGTVKFLAGNKLEFTATNNVTGLTNPIPYDGSDYVVGVDDMNGIPTVYALDQNYPNPFNPSTTIQFQLPKSSEVVIKVYNMLGQLVKTLVNEEVEAGYHKVSFDASRLASGIYFYNIKAGDFVQSKKMILLK